MDNVFDFANTFNKGSKFTFRTPDDFEYKSLEELYKEYGEEKVYTLKAIYINTKGNFGDSPVYVTDFCIVNIPKHNLDTANEILKTKEAIDSINNGKVGFVIYTYIDNKYKKVCYNARFVNL